MQFRLFLLLLKPSLCSTLVVFVAAGFILILLSRTYFVQSHFFYDYFFSLESSQAALERASDNVSGIVNALSSGEWTGTATIFILSVIVSAVLYIGLQLALRILGGAAGALADVQQAPSDSSKKLLEAEIGTRIVTRIAVLLVWLTYWFASVKVLLPFCLLAARTGIDLLPEPSGIGYCVLSYLLLAVGLHMHVILARLVVLRPRLFGGESAIAALLIRK